MRPMVIPELVNGAFGDPGLLIDFKFERRALLLDLGDLGRLPTRKLLRISDVFVSHCHMDHFVGMDRLLRVVLGRAASIRLYGPPHFIDRLEHKLAAYTWNLVESYTSEFVLTAHELLPDGTLRAARFRSRTRFSREPLSEHAAAEGVLLAEPQFLVRATLLDHKTPCLGFAFEERVHVNVWRNGLAELGLPTGPWLKNLKTALLSDAADDTPIRANWRDRQGPHERVLPLGELRNKVVRLTRGQKISYVTDAAYTPENIERIVALADGADLLFIEAAFLDQDAELARSRCHLTARQAGTLGRQARAGAVVPFHFSPRYEGRGAELHAEVHAAFRGPSPARQRAP
jgi:ribonuclease Z